MSGSVFGKVDRWSSCTQSSLPNGPIYFAFGESYSSPVLPGISSEKHYIPSAIQEVQMVSSTKDTNCASYLGLTYSAQAGFELKSHSNLNLSRKDFKFKIKIKVL